VTVIPLDDVVDRAILFIYSHVQMPMPDGAVTRIVLV